MDARFLTVPSSASTAIQAAVTGCAAYTLPARGILSMANGAVVTLTQDVVFRPSCTSTGGISVSTNADSRSSVGGVFQPAIIANGGLNADQTSSSSDPQLSDFRDPFYASTFPQCYALAATTIVSYTLVLMLFIAPRSFLDGGVVVLGRRGFTNGPTNGISIGGRPWLQKIAALTVAISLTIATADTFRVAEDQYGWGIENAVELQDIVLGGTQLKVIRLISDSFLWLAQAQTLIRLFPRQREKIIIKWTAFSLITLDFIFGALDSFQYGNGTSRPRSFTDAVPALSYLFQLSLGLLYAAWVIYYSLMKKRYAYFHPSMKNISLVAALSIISILVPVVFFILDISKPGFAAWGDYVRWVGAAAASVIVWEWVERIEALEREEKKDGILGREIFDGDEMMETSSSEFAWPRRRKSRKGGGGDDGESGRGANDSGPSPGGRINMWPAMSSIASRYISRSGPSAHDQQQKPGNTALATGRSASRFLQPPLWPSRPPAVVTPISRTETASADSTVYAVRYQPLTETVSRTTDGRQERPLSRVNSTASSDAANDPPSMPLPRDISADRADTQTSKDNPSVWRSLISFRGGVRGPPAEVLPHTQEQQTAVRDYDRAGQWDIRGLIEDFAATQAERIRGKLRPKPDTESLEVTVIPAPVRRGAALAQLLEEEELQTTPSSLPPIGATIHPPSGRMTRSGSASSATVPPSPLVLRSNSSASNSSRPIFIPSQRSETLQLRPTRRDHVVSPTSPPRNGENAGDLSPTSHTASRQPAEDFSRAGASSS